MKEKIWKICMCGVIKCGDEFLILKRPDDEQDMPGIWEFPSGNAEVGEDLTQALKREIFEETGIIFENKPSLISISQYNSEKPTYIKCSVQINYLIDFKEKPKVNLSNEHVDYMWVKKDSPFMDEFLLEIVNQI